MSTASKVALRKQKHPELYCPKPRCLWHTGGGYCPRHIGENNGQQNCADCSIVIRIGNVVEPLAITDDVHS